jgi:glycosyltransferase involved in cell wall biosynthesis
LQNLIFLLPLYNDWKSVQKLIGNINDQVQTTNHNADIFIVDDCSPDKEKLNIDDLANIKSLKIIRLNENLGSQKAIAVGLKYLENQKTDSIITIMDSDGEDDSTKINEMTSLANQNREFVVVSCRTKRVEGVFFNILYNIHKFLTFIFTLRWMNFGNYSSFHSSNITKILKKNYAWLAYSSAVSKNCKTKRVYAPRKKRFFGRSKLTSLGLFLHSLRVNLVFFPTIILTSFFYIYLIYFLSFKTFLSFSFISLILLYNCLLISVMMSSKLKDLEETKKFISEKID